MINDKTISVSNFVKEYNLTNNFPAYPYVTGTFTEIDLLEPQQVFVKHISNPYVKHIF